MNECNCKGSVHNECSNCKKWLSEGEPYWTVLAEAKTKEPLPPGIIMMLESAKVGHFGKVTNNDRLYPRKRGQPQLEALNEKLKTRPGSVVGEADHPDPTSGLPTIRNTAIKFFPGFKMLEDGSVMSGRMGIVGTAAGKDTAACVKAGIEVGFSSRSRGSLAKVTMNDQHPEWELNKEHAGKEIEEVEDDWELRTFDAVINQAVEDAKVRKFHEQETPKEDTMFELSKLTPEDWKKILESDQVKEHVNGVADAVTTEQKAKLEEQFEKDVVEAVREYVKSDEFAERFEVLDPDGKPLEEAAKGIKCPECDAQIPSGAKYCPACGARAAAPKVEQTADEKDKKIAEQSAKLDEMSKRVSDMESRETARLEAEKIGEIVTEALEGKPAVLCEAVEKALANVVLESKTAKKVITETIATVESLVKATGGTTAPKQTMTETVRDEGGAAKPKELREDEQKVNSLLHG